MSEARASPPPCGEGSGVGVGPYAKPGAPLESDPARSVLDHPPPRPSPAGGEGERPTLNTNPVSATDLLPLFAWLTPAFPVGGYAYSHGLEQAVEDGDVRDEASLEIWLGEALELGFARNDAILLIAAHRAVSSGELSALTEANDLALAFAPTSELHLETSQQGRSFLDVALAAWPNERLAEAARTLPGEVAYPIAVGIAAAAHGVPAISAASAFLLSVAQALVSAGVRLAPIGQTSGAKIVARLSPLIRRIAAEASTATLDDIASCTFRLDLGSARHETQYTRLFRS